MGTLKSMIPLPQNISCKLLDKLNLVVSYVTDKIVRIKIDSALPGRYQVPIQKDFNIPSFSDENGKTKMYNVSLSNKDASLTIQRNDIGVTLINTTIGGFIYCDKYLQFSTYLPKDTDFYGFGGNYRTSLKHKLNYQTYPLFTRNEKGRNGERQHPFMMGVHKDGRAFGLFFLNSNAMGLLIFVIL